jgi:hypothetical protein
VGARHESDWRDYRSFEFRYRSARVSDCGHLVEDWFIADLGCGGTVSWNTSAPVALESFPVPPDTVAVALIMSWPLAGT